MSAETEEIMTPFQVSAEHERLIDLALRVMRREVNRSLKFKISQKDNPSNYIVLANTSDVPTWAFSSALHKLEDDVKAAGWHINKCVLDTTTYGQTSMCIQLEREDRTPTSSSGPYR